MQTGDQNADAKSLQVTLCQRSGITDLQHRFATLIP